MKNKIFWLLLFVCTCFTGAVAAFPQNNGEKMIKQDDNFIVGKLDNGLTYYIRRNENPKKSAEFFIAHNVGSLQEDDNQRGLAHFLEHMAFNGTKNFPGKNMLNSLAGIGVKFGSNVNAYTSMDRTVYNISAVPVVRESVIDSVLLMLHDWSYYISCEPSEIEAERGVIREEWRRGDDSRTRMIAHIAAVEQSGSRFAQRRVIGLPQIIDTFKPQVLVDYYHKWYRPGLQAIFVVGDIDPADIEVRIKKIFSTIPEGENHAPRLTYDVPDNTLPIIERYCDPELKAGSVRIIVKFPEFKGEQRLKTCYIIDKLMAEMFLDMVSGRTSKNADGGKALYKNAIPSMGAIYYASRVFRITALPQKNNYEKAFTGIISDYERVKKYGFSKDEFSDALKSKRAKLLVEANKNRNPKNVDYVNRAVETFTKGDALMDITDYYKTSIELLDKITVEQMNCFVKENFTDKNLIVLFSGGEKDAVDFSSDERVNFIMDSVKNSNLLEYKYISNTGIKFDYKLSPVALTEISLFSGIRGATQVVLPNGNKIIWIENNNTTSVSFSAIRKGGYSVVPDNLLYNSRMMKSYLGNYIINGMNKNVFLKFCSDNRISLKQDVNKKYDLLSGYFTKNNAELFFKTLYLTMSDVKIDSKNFAAYKQSSIKRLMDIPSAANIFKDSCKALSFKPNIADSGFTAEIVGNMEEKHILEAYRSHFWSSNGFTYIFEGPMTFNQAKPFLEKYIANLPYNKDREHKIIDTRDNIWNKGEIKLRYEADNAISSKATVSVNVKGLVDYNTKNYNCSRFLVLLLRDIYTKSIREERGGSYHVGVTDEFNQYPNSYVTLNIDFDTDTKLVDELLECVWSELKEMAKEPVNQQEIDKIKLYLNKSISSMSKEEFSYMKKVISIVTGEIYIDKYDLDSINSITAKAIKNFARKLMQQKNYSTFVIQPAKKM